MTDPQVRVAYDTDRFEETVRFYEEVLGLETWTSWDRTDSRGALISAGGNAVIEVFSAARGAPPLQPPPRDSFSIMIAVEDVDARYGELVAKGADIAPPVDKPWARQFVVRDPNGVEIYFFTPTPA